MTYEIEIEGLPEGYEPDGKGVYVSGIVDHIISVGIRRKVRKYDWSKTLDDVLVLREYREGAWSMVGARGEQSRVAECWQPNIHGKCPVDPDASVIRVKRSDGAEEVAIARKFNWASWTIIGWKFEYLAEGYEW